MVVNKIFDAENLGQKHNQFSVQRYIVKCNYLRVQCNTLSQIFSPLMKCTNNNHVMNTIFIINDQFNRVFIIGLLLLLHSHIILCN